MVCIYIAPYCTTIIHNHITIRLNVVHIMYMCCAMFYYVVCCVVLIVCVCV